jgi:hypothetical protein
MSISFFSYCIMKIVAFRSLFVLIQLVKAAKDK